MTLTSITIAFGIFVLKLNLCIFEAVLHQQFMVKVFCHYVIGVSLRDNLTYNNDFALI